MDLSIDRLTIAQAKVLEKQKLLQGAGGKLQLQYIFFLAVISYMFSTVIQG